MFFHTISTFVLILISLGLWQRRNRTTHVRLMVSAFVIDIVSLLAIEFQNQAVEKVVGHTVPPLTIFHAAISLVLVFVWVAMVVLGRNILLNKPNAREKHKRMVPWFIILRLTNYVTSFMV